MKSPMKIIAIIAIFLALGFGAASMAFIMEVEKRKAISVELDKMTLKYSYASTELSNCLDVYSGCEAACGDL